MTFTLTAKQQEAQKLLSGPATHLLLAGGSRCVSGDTVLDGHDAPIVLLARVA